MIIEERDYTLFAGKTAEFVEIYQALGLEPQTRILGNLIGWFTTEFGDLNHVVHMWGYSDYEDRVKRRKTLFEDEQFKKYLAAVRPLIQHQYSRILMPTAFSPLKTLPNS